MFIKLHKTPEREIISICDEDILGKKFETEDLQLDIKESFYKGDIYSEKHLKIVKNADYLNIVGKESINFAIKNNLINKENIMRIKKIPYAISILK